MSEDYSYLDTFNQDFVPEHGGIRPTVTDTLADGDYDFEIVDAQMKHVNGKGILELGLKVNGGAVMQHAYWFEKQGGANNFGADCLILGIDSSQWGKKIPLSQAIPAAINRLPGIKFRATKKVEYGKPERDGTKKEYKKLILQCLINGKPMPGSTPAPTPKGATKGGKVPF